MISQIPVHSSPGEVGGLVAEPATALLGRPWLYPPWHDS